MAIAYSQSTTVASGASVTSVTTGAITTTTGNLLVALAASYVQTATVSDSKGNTWTNVASFTAGTGRVRMDYVLNATGGASHTFTATCGSADYPTITVMEFSGVATSSALDVSATDFVSGGSSSHTVGPVTTTDAGDVLIGVGSSPSSTSYTVSAPFTQDRTLDTGALEGIVTGYYLPGSTGNYSFDFTTSNSSAAARSIIAAFKPAAGGGGAVLRFLTILGAGA